MRPTEMTIFASPGAEHQQRHAKALRKALEADGVRVTMSAHGVSARTKHVAVWGWRVGRLLRQRGHEVLVMERGYVGDRFAWTSLGWNGLNGRATFRPCDDPARFQTHFSMLLQPWKDGGDYVLLIGQVPGDASLGGMDLSRWYADSTKSATKAYGLPVRFRPHPMATKRGIRYRVPDADQTSTPRTLAEDLAGAAVVVTFNSNTSVESVLAGVPTIAFDKGSMAFDMCGKQIGAVWKPDRNQWAARLAWCQWTMGEIESGEAWKAVRPS